MFLSIPHCLPAFSLQSRCHLAAVSPHVYQLPRCGNPPHATDPSGRAVMVRAERSQKSWNRGFRGTTREAVSNRDSTIRKQDHSRAAPAGSDPAQGTLASRKHDYMITHYSLPVCRGLLCCLRVWEVPAVSKGPPLPEHCRLKSMSWTWEELQAQAAWHLVVCKGLKLVQGRADRYQNLGNVTGYSEIDVMSDVGSCFLITTNNQGLFKKPVLVYTKSAV